MLTCQVAVAILITQQVVIAVLVFNPVRRDIAGPSLQ